MAKMTARQQVTTYCRQTGLKVCGKHGVPMLSNAAASWVECFDDWAQALAFLVKARNAHFDAGKALPWA
jgi:hypothetical protein